MTVQRDPEAILAAWLDEGPTDLPNATRRAILTALPTTPQARRGFLAPRRNFPMLTPARAALALVIATIAVGGALSVIRIRSEQGTNVTPSPAASHPATPRATSTPDLGTPSPLQGHAGSFTEPFSYTLPASAGIVVSDTIGIWQFRHPSPSPTPDEAYDGGVIVREVSGGRVNPCSETSTALPLADPQAFVAYFRTIPTVNVSDVRPTTVDGRPAVQAVLGFGAATADCRDVWLWTEEGAVTQNAGRNPVRITIVDIDGSHFAILATGSDLARWMSITDAFLFGMHFDSPRPSPSPGPG
jgi:hypothetical protein